MKPSAYERHVMNIERRKTKHNHPVETNHHRLREIVCRVNITYYSRIPPINHPPGNAIFPWPHARATPIRSHLQSKASGQIHIARSRYMCQSATHYWLHDRWQHLMETTYQAVPAISGNQALAPPIPLISRYGHIN